MSFELIGEKMSRSELEDFISCRGKEATQKIRILVAHGILGTCLSFVDETKSCQKKAAYFFVARQAELTLGDA